MNEKVDKHGGQRFWVLAVILVFWGAGCRFAPQSASGKTRLRVLAASSLTQAFGALEARFEAQHPQVDLEFVFAGSQILRIQVEQGLRAQVFASANSAHLQALAKQGLCQTPVTFAANELAVLLAPQAPKIQRFDQIPQIGSWVMGTPAVPVGAYTERWLEKLSTAWGPGPVQQIRSKIRSREPNVRLVASKVALGQADAAVVYRSELQKGAAHLVIPQELNVRARYQMAILGDGPPKGVAQDFVKFVQSKPAQDLLVAHGFLRTRS